MRIYDTRIGKFLSVDPLSISYPWLTPYQFAGNQTIEATDLDGLEPNTLNRPTTYYRPSTGYRTTNGGYPAGRSSNRGGKINLPEYEEAGDLELETAPRAHSNYDPSKYVWFDANGHPQTDIVSTPNIEPIKDPVAQKLSQNLMRSKLEEGRQYKTIGLGLDQDLHRHNGKAITYLNAGWQNAQLTKENFTKAMYDPTTFWFSFTESAKNATNIRFDITNFNQFYKAPSVTLKEFNYIINNPELLLKTTFIENGVEKNWNGTSFEDIKPK